MYHRTLDITDEQKCTTFPNKIWERAVALVYQVHLPSSLKLVHTCGNQAWTQMSTIQIVYYRFSHNIYIHNFFFLAFPFSCTTFPSAFTNQQRIPQTLLNCAYSCLSNKSHGLFLLLFSSRDVLCSQPCLLMLFILLHSCCSE